MDGAGIRPLDSSRPGAGKAPSTQRRASICWRADHMGGITVKRILSTAVALAALVLLPVAAQATTSVTIHVNGAPIDVGPAGCVAGDLVIAGNGVLHTTTNNAGDSWTTGTIEGNVTASDPSSGYTAHGVAWFGVEQNSSNFVTHFIADSVGTLGNGTPLRIHQEGQFTINAQGMPVVTRVTVTCS